MLVRNAESSTMYKIGSNKQQRLNRERHMRISNLIQQDIANLTVQTACPNSRLTLTNSFKWKLLKTGPKDGG